MKNTFRFVKPDGQSFDSAAPNPTEWTRIVAAHEAHAIVITPQTAVTRWMGESLDHDLAVGWLMERKRQCNLVSLASSSIGSEHCGPRQT